jgi:hypothetical protein
MQSSICREQGRVHICSCQKGNSLNPMGWAYGSVWDILYSWTCGSVEEERELDTAEDLWPRMQNSCPHHGFLGRGSCLARRMKLDLMGGFHLCL